MEIGFKLDTPIRKGLQERLQAMADLSDFYNKHAAPILRRDIEDIFQRGGSPKWTPRKPQNPPVTHPLLRRTGRLYNSLSKPGGENIMRVTKSEVVFGTSVPYANYLEEGTKRMPARPILKTVAKSRRGAQKSTKTNLVNALIAYLERRARKGQRNT